MTRIFHSSPHHYHSSGGGFRKIHRGARMQSGGSIFGTIAKLFARLLPMAKNATRVVGNTAARVSKSEAGKAFKNIAQDTATSVLADVIEGKNISDSTTKGVTDARKQIATVLRKNKKTPKKAKFTSLYKEVARRPTKRKSVKFATKAKPKRMKIDQYEDGSEESE